MLHVDMDTFYASVEIAKDPSLKDVPVAVISGGRRSIVLAANYPARKFGLRAALPTFMAKQKCPSARYIIANMHEYRTISTGIMQLFYHFSPFVQPISVDEAFIDASGLTDITPYQLAQQIRAATKKRYGINCSVGIGKNRSIAKIASRQAKPDGIFEVPAAQTMEFLRGLEVRALWGVGRSTYKKLDDINIETIDDLLHFDRKLLENKLGKAATQHVLRLANGGDLKHLEHKDKSVSLESTFEYCITGEAEINKQLLRIADKVAARMRRKQKITRTIVLIVKNARFQVFNRNKTVPFWTDSTKQIYQTVKQLAVPYHAETIRMLGVRLDNLHTNTNYQKTFDDALGKDIDAAVDKARQKFGNTSLHFGTLLD
jgi:DNA polymerase-4